MTNDATRLTIGATTGPGEDYCVASFRGQRLMSKPCRNCGTERSIHLGSFYIKEGVPQVKDVVCGGCRGPLEVYVEKRT
jgi:hypothetical protein